MPHAECDHNAWSSAAEVPVLGGVVVFFRELPKIAVMQLAEKIVEGPKWVDPLPLSSPN